MELGCHLHQELSGGYLREDERQWGRFCCVCFLGIRALGLTPYRTEGQKLNPSHCFVGEHKVHGLGLFEEEQFIRKQDTT